LQRATHKHGLDDDVPVKSLHALNDTADAVVPGRTVDGTDVLLVDGIEFQDVVVHQHECVADWLTANHR